MQLLYYLCLLSIFIDFSAGYDVYTIILDIIRLRFSYNEHFRAAGIIIAYGITLTLSCLISLFFKFHVQLVLSNSTTIESLDKEHKEEYAKVRERFIFICSLICRNGKIGIRFLERMCFFGFYRLEPSLEDRKETVLHGLLM